MNYNQEVKATQEVRQAIESLTEQGDAINISYKGKEYYIKCYDSADGRWEPGLSITELTICPQSMNIKREGKIGTFISLYDYNLMGQRTDYKMKLIDIELLP